MAAVTPRRERRRGGQPACALFRLHLLQGRRDGMAPARRGRCTCAPIQSPRGSLRPEQGIESGRNQREAVDFRPPRTSSSSRRCRGRVHSPEAVVRALRWLGWQGCTRANNFATSSRWRMRAAPVMLRLRGNASPRRHPVSRLAKQSLHLPARCPSSPPAVSRFRPACCPNVGSPSPAASRAPSTSSQASTSVLFQLVMLNDYLI